MDVQDVANMVDQDVLEELTELCNSITEALPELSAFEIIDNAGDVPIHISARGSKAAIPNEFAKYYACLGKGDIESACGLETTYRGVKYSFTRAFTISDSSAAFLLISVNQGESQEKSSMVIVVDSSNAIFIATSPLDHLRRVYSGLIARIYPEVAGSI